MRYSGGISLNDVYKDIYKRSRNGQFDGEKFGKLLKVIRLEDGAPSHTDYEIIDSIIEKLEDNGRTEGDLIDLLISALKMPFCGNLMAGKTMDKIKKSLMLPSELVGLEAHLKAQEKGCLGCGNPFVENEAVVYYKTPEGSNVIYCMRCATPHWAACQECQQKAPFAERFASKKYKDCSSHNGARESKAKSELQAMLEAQALHAQMANGLGQVRIKKDDQYMEQIVRMGGQLPVNWRGQAMPEPYPPPVQIVPHANDQMNVHPNLKDYIKYNAVPGAPFDLNDPLPEPPMDPEGEINF